MSSPPKLENITVSLDAEQNAIAILTFNRPKNGNALNTPLISDYLSALRWTEQTDDVRIVVTTGAGKFFTAGLDLLDQSVSQPDATISDEFVDTLGAIHAHLINTNKLIISAVNGPAPGWGTSHIALSDLVYASPSSIFFTPFVQWGLCAEGCSSLTFTRILGRQKAAALILAGQRMTAAELESAGLVTKILPPENFLGDVLQIARGVAKLPRESLRTNKELMVGRWRGELLEANEVEMRMLKEQARKGESREAIAGFARETERKRREKQQGAKL